MRLAQLLAFAMALLPTAVVAQLSCTVHYTCTSAQCASVIGGYNVTKGPFPFASESSCLSQARTQMTTARCTCTRSGGAASGTPAASGGNESAAQAAANATNRVINAGNFNTANNAAMTMGAGVLTGLAVYGLRSAMEGPSPAELARREAVRQEQMRLQAEAEERARLERERRHQSLVAGLQGYQGGAQRLDIVRTDTAAPASNLALIKRGDAAEAAPVQATLAPFPQGGGLPSLAAGPGGNLGLLKRGDESLEAASMEARKPFDTAGTLTLPAAPPTPASAPVAPAAIAMAPPTAAEIAAAPAGIRQGAADAVPPPNPQSTGSASAAVDSIMPNRAERPHVTYGAAVHQPGPVYRPGAPPAVPPAAVQQAAVAPAPAAPAPPPAQPANNPFAIGAADANACRANNSGPVCAGLVNLAWSQCRAAYDQGYAAGASNLETTLNGAYNNGVQARVAGRSNESFTAAPQDGCRQNWIVKYNRGYAGSPP